LGRPSIKREDVVPYGRAMALRDRARSLRDMGRIDEARNALAEALALLESSSDPAAEETRRELEGLG
jgi:hypothetical protein